MFYADLEASGKVTGKDMKKVYPKILIIGESFHLNSGGGITLSNLFNKWPKDHLSNAIDYRKQTINVDYSDVPVFELYNYIKIFNIVSFNKIYNYRGNSNLNNRISIASQKLTIRTIIKGLLFQLLEYVNLKHSVFIYQVSNELISWIEDFKPDYIYSQLSSRGLISFVSKIHQITKVPIAVHIMDDWPTTISSKGLFKNFWKKKIDEEFRRLLDKSTIFLSISEQMGEEYQKRYNKKFIPFHNPIDMKLWCNESSNKDSKKLISKDCISILHAGRIGFGIETSLLTIAKTIQMLNQEGYNIKFKIQSSFVDSSFLSEAIKYSCVTINPPVSYKEIPHVFRDADILILCQDFDERGLNFLKYSMPTKASEYMISRRPIIVFSDKSSAVFKSADKYKWAYPIGENDINSLKNGIIELIENNELALKCSENAYKHARENYDSTIVLEKFRRVFEETVCK